MNRGPSHHDRCAGAGGFTLIEMIVSMIIISILLTAISSAMLITARAMPDPRRADDVRLATSRVIDQMLGELQSARFVTERTAAAITFIVPDRDNDGDNERVRYAWSGTAGDPLTRQYNGGPVVTILGGVHSLNMTSTLTQSVETYPGAAVESSEMLISSNLLPLIQPSYDLQPAKGIAQYLLPSLPLGTLRWKVTRAQVYVKASPNKDGVSGVRLYRAGSNQLPTSPLLAERLLYESSLASSYAWHETTFNLGGLNPNDRLCLALVGISGTDTITTVMYDAAGLGGKSTTLDGGASWSPQLLETLVHRVYGTYSTAASDQTARRDYLTAMHIAIQAGPSAASKVESQLQMLNAPQIISRFWELNFDRRPTSIDLDADGAPDWTVRGGGAFNVASLVNGVWQADAVLDTNPNHNFTELTTVDVRFRNTSIGGSGAVFTISPDWLLGMNTKIICSLALQSNGTQRLTVVAQGSVGQTTLLTVFGLPTTFVNLRLLIDPVADSVNIKVNGVQHGTYTYLPFPSVDNARIATLEASGSSAEFEYLRIIAGGN